MSDWISEIESKDRTQWTASRLLTAYDEAVLANAKRLLDAAREAEGQKEGKCLS